MSTIRSGYFGNKSDNLFVIENPDHKTVNLYLDPINVVLCHFRKLLEKNEVDNSFSFV